MEGRKNAAMKTAVEKLSQKWTQKWKDEKKKEDDEKDSPPRSAKNKEDPNKAESADRSCSKVRVWGVCRVSCGLILLATQLRSDFLSQGRRDGRKGMWKGYCL